MLVMHVHLQLGQVTPGIWGPMPCIWRLMPAYGVHMSRICDRYCFCPEKDAIRKSRHITKPQTRTETKTEIGGYIVCAVVVVVAEHVLEHELTCGVGRNGPWRRGPDSTSKYVYILKAESQRESAMPCRGNETKTTKKSTHAQLQGLLYLLD